MNPNTKNIGGISILIRTCYKLHILKVDEYYELVEGKLPTNNREYFALILHTKREHLHHAVLDLASELQKRGAK